MVSVTNANFAFFEFLVGFASENIGWQHWSLAAFYNPNTDDGAKYCVPDHTIHNNNNNKPNLFETKQDNHMIKEQKQIPSIH